MVSAFKSPPDLILLDILMPELDGYEVCRHLKEDERARHIPALFISTLDEVFDKMRAFSSGGVDYITKPFQTEAVLARIETHLTIRRLQLELQQKNQSLQTANETLEEKVQARTAELAQANHSLKSKIERRKRHQQEKDRLVKVVCMKNPFPPQIAQIA